MALLGLKQTTLEKIVCKCMFHFLFRFNTHFERFDMQKAMYVLFIDCRHFDPAISEDKNRKQQNTNMCICNSFKILNMQIDPIFL